MKKYIAGLIIGLIAATTFVVQAGNPITPIAGGGTGTSTIPTFGQLLVGQANGTYKLQATSTLGISGGSSQ